MTTHLLRGQSRRGHWVMWCGVQTGPYQADLQLEADAPRDLLLFSIGQGDVDCLDCTEVASGKRPIFALPPVHSSVDERTTATAATRDNPSTRVYPLKYARSKTPVLPIPDLESIRRRLGLVELRTVDTAALCNRVEELEANNAKLEEELATAIKERGDARTLVDQWRQRFDQLVSEVEATDDFMVVLDAVHEFAKLLEPKAAPYVPDF